MEEKMEEVLRNLGFEKCETTTDGETVEEPYSQDYSFLKETVTAPLYIERTVHYKNEYHDEPLRQVQMTEVIPSAGLGTVKDLLQKFADAYFAGSGQITLRPAFIYETVPAIEASIGNIRFAAGGLVRPEVMRRNGLDPKKVTGISVTVLPEHLEEIGQYLKERS